MRLPANVGQKKTKIIEQKLKELNIGEYSLFEFVLCEIYVVNVINLSFFLGSDYENLWYLLKKIQCLQCSYV